MSRPDQIEMSASCRKLQRNSVVCPVSSCLTLALPIRFAPGRWARRASNQPKEYLAPGHPRWRGW